MEVVCLETQAFYSLVDEVVKKLREQHKEKPKWVSTEEALEILHITSKTTLQKFRDEGRIRFSQPSAKVILYDRESLDEFLEKHAKATF